MISCNVIERVGFLERVNEKAYSFVFIQIVKIPSNELHGGAYSQRILRGDLFIYYI